MVVLGAVPGDCTLRGSKETHLFPHRSMDIFYKDQRIGSFGIVHPTVLRHFKICHACSVLEINLEPFL